MGCIGVIPDESTVKTNSQFPWPLLKLRLQWSPVSLFRQCGRGLFYMTYSEKLKDPRWQKKRLEVLERAGWVCEDCGTDTKQLEVHHPHYIKGREPWEYDRSLMCLCSACHIGRQAAESDIKIWTMAIVRQMKPKEVKAFHAKLFKKSRSFFAT